MVKLHVSACNGYHQVSTPIKKSLYICVRVCWCWCVNPLFVLLSSANCYI